MPTVTFTPSGKSAVAESGATVMDAARKAGVPVDAPCGGKGSCGKCLVRIVSGNVSPGNTGKLTPEELADGYVLACMAKVTDTDVTAEVPEPASREGGKFIPAGEDAMLVRQDLFPKSWQYDPLAVKWLVKVAEPKAGDGLSDLDRLIRAIQRDWGMKDIVCSLHVLRKLADAVRKENGAVTVTIIREERHYHVVGIEAGDMTGRLYGVAVDLGTTTVAVQLVHLPSAESLVTLTDYNEQISCGLDVISRINYASKPERLEELREKALHTINRLVERAAAMSKVSAGEICNAVVSGNTTMTHLLLGLPPERIRLDPYVPTIMSAPYLTAAEVGININPQSWIYLSPCVGSYVGGI
jgi:uncharacterized 2Fe-2S/4Fe-4S cluster protein (DUF4445 family)